VSISISPLSPSLPHSLTPFLGRARAQYAERGGSTSNQQGLAIHLSSHPSLPPSLPSPGRVRAQYAERGGSSSNQQGLAVSAFVALNPRDQSYGKEGVFIRSACYKV